MNSIFVDIILPNYNKEKFLEEAISSVLNQTFVNWKLYIIDDASTDDSKLIIDKFKNNSKIIIKKLSKNKGPGFCRNLGIRLSSSNFIAFLDSDDYWTKNKLKDQMSFMTQNNHNFTFSDFTPFFHLKNDKKFVKQTNIASQFNLLKFTLNSSINTSTMILSRNLIKKFKFKKIKKLEDYLFKCEILKKGIIAYKLNQNTAYYRILKKSRSSEKIKNIYNLWKINQKYLGYNIFLNLFSILMISINSLKKYGIK